MPLVIDAVFMDVLWEWLVCSTNQPCANLAATFCHPCTSLEKEEEEEEEEKEKEAERGTKREREREREIDKYRQRKRKREK